MFMGGCETRTPAPPQDTQEGRVEGKCSCFTGNVKCMVQIPLPEGGGGGGLVVLGLIAAGVSQPMPQYSLFCGQF